MEKAKSLQACKILGQYTAAKKSARLNGQNINKIVFFFTLFTPSHHASEYFHIVTEKIRLVKVFSSTLSLNQDLSPVNLTLLSIYSINKLHRFKKVTHTALFKFGLTEKHGIVFDVNFFSYFSHYCPTFFIRTSMNHCK